MKKKILPVVAAAFMCASAFAFGACTEGKPELDKVEAKPATCTENGNVEYYTDGTKYFLDADGTVEIPFADTVVNATGHSPKSEFSASGTQHWHDCSVCGDPTDAKTAHTPDAAWQTGDGKHWHNCSVCLKPVGEKQDHEFDWVIDRAATETTAGIKHEECECGEKRNENTEIPMIGATIPHERVEPTCGADGNIAYWEKDGKYYRDEACTDEITLEDTVLTATGEHTQKSGFEKDGAQHWHVCSVCGNLIGEKQDHEFDWVIDRAATETTAGIKHEECECGEKRNENTEIPMIGATIPHERVEPTCGADGNIAYWEKDGKYYRDEDCTDEIALEDTVLTATGEHTSDNVWHSSDGKHWNECSVCRAHLNESDHDDAANIAWTDNGDEHVKTCSCSLILQREAHTYSDAVTEPTCTTGGFTAHTCVCGKSYIDGEVDALGHDWNAEDSVYEGGKFYKVCKRDTAHKEEITDVNADDYVKIGDVTYKPYECYDNEHIGNGVTYNAVKKKFIIDASKFADGISYVGNDSNSGIIIVADTDVTVSSISIMGGYGYCAAEFIGSGTLTVTGNFATQSFITVNSNLTVQGGYSQSHNELHVASGTMSVYGTMSVNRLIVGDENGIGNPTLNVKANGANGIVKGGDNVDLQFLSGTVNVQQGTSGGSGIDIGARTNKVFVGENAMLKVKGFINGFYSSWIDVHGILWIANCTNGVNNSLLDVSGTAIVQSEAFDNVGIQSSDINILTGGNVNIACNKGIAESALIVNGGNLDILAGSWALDGGSVEMNSGKATLMRSGGQDYAAFSSLNKLTVAADFDLGIKNLSQLLVNMNSVDNIQIAATVTTENIGNFTKDMPEGLTVNNVDGSVTPTDITLPNIPDIE